METSKITEAINNGFNSLLEKLGITNKANDESVKNALSEFSTSIINATKGSVPAGGKKGQVLTKASDADYDMDWEDDDDSGEDAENKVKNIVNKAVANALESAQKDFLKADAIKDFVKADAIKDMLTATSFQEEMKNLKTDLIQKVSGGKIENTNKNTNKKKPADAKWAYENLWETAKS